MIGDRLSELERLIATLRGPDGCPWDRQQSLADLRAYLLEEAHETAAAIDEEDWSGLAGELGDLLFQIVFVVHLAAESGAFDMDTVVRRVADKMVARHPHVFGGEPLADPAAVRRAWESRKVETRSRSLLADLPPSTPALLASYRMTQKAAGVGFDWQRASAVLAKLEEEIAELRAELAEPPTAGSRRRQREELGDLLFTAANLARHLEVDPEAALAGANRKFRSRFQAVEEKLAERGQRASDVDQSELERLWDEVKRDESESETDPA